MLSKPISFKGEITLKNYSLCRKNANGMQLETVDLSPKTINTRDIVNIKYIDDKEYTAIAVIEDDCAELKEYRVPKSCAPQSTILAAYNYVKNDPGLRVIL